jgi:RecG-like helicase
MYRGQLGDSITTLEGVGKAVAADYRNLGITTLADLVNLAPRAWDDRSVETELNDVREEKAQILCPVRVDDLTYFGDRSPRGRTLKVITRDRNGTRLSLLCFGRNFLERMLRPGSIWYFVGTVTRNMYEWQSTAFEMYPTAEKAGAGTILPIYPLSGNLTQRIIRRDMRAVLSRFEVEDELPLSLREKYRLLSTHEALKEYNFPTSPEKRDLAARTLSFTELFYLELQINRNFKPRKYDRAEVPLSALEKKLIASLPFALTESQEKVLREIRSDLKSGGMNRLLEGDVGSGKTLVAWLSALSEISKGGQVAFMAPTELLARQHAENAASLLAPLGVRLAFITGDVKGKGRSLLLKALKNGEIDIAIGTHALFSKDVVFKNLTYAIIDEQHRFGVDQREALAGKGYKPNILLMSATPIPRSLALTLFSDAAISTIDTLPSGRKPITTFLVKEENREKMYQTVKIEFLRDHQAYFVYPRIGDEEEEEEGELRDVIKMFDFLKKEYPGIPSALIHSKLPEEEKQQILSDFKAKKLKYLVSTSVIEVGIDIPDATCMVIEHAERFGLAALHQLRGRVGRSALQSYCFLVFSDNLTDIAKARLKCMKESTDGFYIAEQDLLIRGPGDITGLQQSGFFRLNFSSLVRDTDTLAAARAEAVAILAADPGLISAENAPIRIVSSLLESKEEKQ